MISLKRELLMSYLVVMTFFRFLSFFFSRTLMRFVCSSGPVYIMYIVI